MRCALTATLLLLLTTRAEARSRWFPTLFGGATWDLLADEDHGFVRAGLAHRPRHGDGLVWSVTIDADFPDGAVRFTPTARLGVAEFDAGEQLNVPVGSVYGIAGLRLFASDGGTEVVPAIRFGVGVSTLPLVFAANLILPNCLELTVDLSGDAVVLAGWIAAGF